MDEDTKEEIIELLMAIYKIPGQWFIGGIILLWIGKSMIEYTNYRITLVFFGVIFIVLEVVSPILAGYELYKKAIDGIKNFFEID